MRNQIGKMTIFGIVIGQGPATELWQPEQFFLIGLCNHAKKILDMSLREAGMSLLEEIEEGKGDTLKGEGGSCQRG